MRSRELGWQLSSAHGHQGWRPTDRPTFPGGRLQLLLLLLLLLSSRFGAGVVASVEKLGWDSLGGGGEDGKELKEAERPPEGVGLRAAAAAAQRLGVPGRGVDARRRRLNTTSTAMEQLFYVLLKLFSLWFTLGFLLIVLPSLFGASLGISELYIKVLVKTLEVGEPPPPPGRQGGGGRHRWALPSSLSGLAGWLAAVFD